jgi:hypothetical protein
MNNNQISEVTQQAILEFVDECRANNLSIARRVKYLYTLPILAQRLGKDFDSATVDDIKKLVGQINDGEGYADWTKTDFRVTLNSVLLGRAAGFSVGYTMWNESEGALTYLVKPLRRRKGNP